LAATIRGEIEDVEVELVPGGRGDFIVVADRRELWNKKNSGRGFPSEDEIVAAIRAGRRSEIA
jgi:predicted Rdx family selenoprotein